MSLEDTINRIDGVFYEASFNPVEYYFQVLQDDEDDDSREKKQLAEQERLLTLKTALDQAIQEIVNENYTEFNDSLRTFTDIYTTFDGAQQQIDQMLNHVNDCRAVFEADTDLQNVLLQQLEAEMTIEWINQLQFLQQAPAQILIFINEKQYIRAAEHLNKSLELLFSPTIVELDCCDDVRDQLMDSKQLIENVLITDLHTILFMQNEMDIFVNKEHPNTIEAILDQQNEQIQRLQLDSLKNNQGQGPMDAIVVLNKLVHIVQALNLLNHYADALVSIKNIIEAQLKGIIVKLRSCHHYTSAPDTLSSQGSLYLSKSRDPINIMSKKAIDISPASFLHHLFQVLEQIMHRQQKLMELIQRGNQTFESCYTLDDFATKVFAVLDQILDEIFVPTQIEPSAGDESAKQELGNFTFSLEENKSALKTDSDLLHFTFQLVASPSILHLRWCFNFLLARYKSIQSIASRRFSIEHTSLDRLVYHNLLPQIRRQAQQLVEDHSMASRSEDAHSKSVENLFQVINQYILLLEQLPDYRKGLLYQIEAIVKDWYNQASLRFTDLTQGSLTSRELANMDRSIAYRLQQTKLYRAAKGGSPITPSLPKAKVKKHIGDVFEYEMQFEQKYLNVDHWNDYSQDLIVQTSQFELLRSIASASDRVSCRITTIMENFDRSSCSQLQNLQSECSVLADECLFFLRKELRLHCYYYLHQMTQQAFDLPEDEPIQSAQRCVLSLNHDICYIIQQFARDHEYVHNDPLVLFVIDDLDRLLPAICRMGLRNMAGRKFTLSGIDQVLFNLRALKQNWSCMVFQYTNFHRERVKLMSKHFTHSERYFRLLELSEDHLVKFITFHFNAYTPEEYRALTRIVTPYRVPTNASITKFDKLLQSP